MKPDEHKLLETLQRRTANYPIKPYVRQAVIDLNMNQKRAAYILEKWADKGWYDYGVSVMAGWLTEKGMAQQGGAAA